MSQLVQTNTKDVRLFAALAAMGIPWEQESAAVVHGERVWLFGDVSDCGKWKLPELLKWWRDGRFHESNPEHPFTVVKATMASGAGLKRYINNGGGITQRKTGGSYVIKHVPEGNESGASLRATDDAVFASCLSGVGFKVWASQSVGNRRVFGVSERSDSRGYEYAHARAWWLDKGFEAQNGQHPFAYAKAVALTYRNAVESLVKDRPLVKWQPPKSVGWAYIHPDCSAETERQIGEKLKGK